MRLYGAIEGGGTNFVVLAGRSPQVLLARDRFDTTTPGETLEQCLRFFRQVQTEHELVALGIASFGPIDLDPASSTYGYITATPKPGWSFTEVAGRLGRALGTPVGWDTDTNGALLGEQRWGAARGIDPVVYVTVGTGVGGAAFVNGALVHGVVHPEMGHLLMPELADDPFAGNCPFHGRCLEGLISGPAIAARRGQPASALPDDDPVWFLVAEYLAIALMGYTLVLSPRRILLGGGVVQHRPALLPALRVAFHRRLGGYVRHPLLLQRLDDYVQSPALGDDAGSFGALELARRAVGDAAE